MSSISPDMAWAASTPMLTSTERLVLMMVVVVLDGARTGRVSQGDVGDRCRLSRSTVNRTMAALAAANLISVEKAGPGAGEVTVHPDLDVLEKHTKVSHSSTPRCARGAQQDGLVSHRSTSWCAEEAHQGPTEGASTVLKKIPPPTEGGVGGGFTTTTTATDYVKAPDHFAQRRDTTTAAADIDPARFQALAKAIAGRATSGRSRFSVEDLTSRETVTVRGLIAEHGIDAVEQVVAGMPDRVDHPTAMLSYRLGRRAEAQRDAARGRAALLSEPEPPPPRLQPSDDPAAHARSAAAFDEMLRIMESAS